MHPPRQVLPSEPAYVALDYLCCRASQVFILTHTGPIYSAGDRCDRTVFNPTPTRGFGCVPATGRPASSENPSSPSRFGCSHPTQLFVLPLLPSEYDRLDAHVSFTFHEEVMFPPTPRVFLGSANR